MRSVNRILDVSDAFVREARASLEHASQAKFYRRVLLRGMPGAYRHSASGIETTVYSGDDGHYVLPALNDGHYELRAHHPRYDNAPRTLELGAQVVRLPSTEATRFYRLIQLGGDGRDRNQITQ